MNIKLFSKNKISLVAIVIALVVMMMTSLLHHHHNHKVDAIFGPDLNLTLEDPGTFSTTYSPRRIAVQVNLTFSPDSNIIGPVEAYIPVTSYSTKCKFTRFTWSQEGTLYPAQHMYSITFRNPILSWDAFEKDAFLAMKNIFMTVGASSSAQLINSSVCVFFEKLTVVNIDNTKRSFSAAYDRCHNIYGGFLATLLKPTDEATMLAALSTGTGDYWVGGWARDQRPSDSYYCWRDDPDFEESGCVTNGYYAYFQTTRTGVNTCMRPAGFPCSTSDMDWDSTSYPSSKLFNIRLHYTGSEWNWWDRDMNSSNLLGAICTNLQSYLGDHGATCHKPTITLVQPTMTGSMTFSLSETSSRSISKTLTLTKSASSTSSVSISKSLSLTSSSSATISESETITPTKSRSRSVFSKTKLATPSRSATWTGETATGTFHSWQTCGEGWTLFSDDFCYKTWPINHNNVNETLPTRMTFDDSLRFCEQFGAHIPPVQNLAQLKFMMDMFGVNSGRRWWNGVYQDQRFYGHDQVWRTVYNRSRFQDFFVWDARRRMPHHEDCVAVHNYGDLGQRIVGGNGAMITYSCDKRAEVICARRREPWGVTAVNETTSGRILAIEGKPLVLNIVGRRLPKGMRVQLQTTDYKTHAGLEGEPTHCSETKPRDPILFNVSVPAVALNVTPSYRSHPLCNGTCDVTNVHFPSTFVLERGKKYSICFFMPYHYPEPTSSDEYRWEYLPNVWVEVAESRANYLRETCDRQKDLIELLYYDNTATDSTRNVQTPWYFDGPIEPAHWQGEAGFRP